MLPILSGKSPQADHHKMLPLLRFEQAGDNFHDVRLTQVHRNIGVGFLCIHQSYAVASGFLTTFIIV